MGNLNQNYFDDIQSQPRKAKTIDPVTQQVTPIEAPDAPNPIKYFPQELGNLEIQMYQDAVGWTPVSQNEPYAQWSTSEKIRETAKQIIPTVIGELRDTVDEEGKRKLEFEPGVVQKAAVGAVKAIPREIARFGASIYQPWAELFTNGRKKQSGYVKLPYDDEPSPTYWKGYEEARESGMSPLAATLASVTDVAGSVAVVGATGEAISALFKPTIGTVLKGNRIVPDTRAQVAVQKNLVSKTLVPKQKGTEYFKVSTEIAARVAEEQGLKSTENIFIRFKPAGKDLMSIDMVQQRPGIGTRIYQGLKPGKTVTETPITEVVLERNMVKVPEKAMSQALSDPGTGVASEMSVSKLNTAKNTLATQPETAKPGGLDRAIKEMQEGTAKPIRVRTLEDGTLFIEDGRHRLEAANQLGVKNVAVEDVTSFYETKPSNDSLARAHILQKEKGIDDNLASQLKYAISGEKSLANMTSTQVEKYNQLLKFMENVREFETVSPAIGVGSYIRAARDTLGLIENRSGGRFPVYSETYLGFANAEQNVKVFRNSQGRFIHDLFGKLSKERNLAQRELIIKKWAGEKVELSPKLQEIETKLRAKFDELGEIFGVEGYIENYFPLIHKSEGVAKAFPRGIPKELKFFAELERQGGFDMFETDPIKLYNIYVSAGSRKLFYQPQLESWQSLRKHLPTEVQNYVESFVRQKIGWQDDTRKLVTNSIQNIGNKLGSKIGSDTIRNFENLYYSTTYGGALGYRPMAVIRNLHQSMLMTYPEVGPEWFAYGVRQAAKKGGVEAAAEEGFLLKYGVPHEEAIGSKPFAGGYKNPANLYTAYRQAGLTFYTGADVVNRSVVYHAVDGRFNNALNKFLDGKIDFEKFKTEIDLDGSSPALQNTVIKNIQKGNYDQARKDLIRDAIDRTQFPYRRGEGARPTWSTAGRWASQFMVWPHEYASTLIGRWAGRGQWDKMIRWLASGKAVVDGWEDAGVDVKRWIWSGPLQLSLPPIPDAIRDISNFVSGTLEGNKKKIDDAAAEIARGLPNLAFGVEESRIKDFVERMNNNWQVRDRKGNLLYTSNATEELLRVFGFSTTHRAEFFEQIKEANVESDNLQFVKSEAIQKLREGDVQGATELIKKYQIVIDPNQLQDKNLYLRVFERLPKQLKAQYADPQFLQGL